MSEGATLGQPGNLRDAVPVEKPVRPMSWARADRCRRPGEYATKQFHIMYAQRKVIIFAVYDCSEPAGLNRKKDWHILQPWRVTRKSLMNWSGPEIFTARYEKADVNSPL
jgi:hypothetical protein